MARKRWWSLPPVPAASPAADPSSETYMYSASASVSSFVSPTCSIATSQLAQAFSSLLPALLLLLLARNPIMPMESQGACSCPCLECRQLFILCSLNPNSSPDTASPDLSLRLSRLPPASTPAHVSLPAPGCAVTAPSFLLERSTSS
jgi:hypothetical protein